MAYTLIKRPKPIYVPNLCVNLKAARTVLTHIVRTSSTSVDSLIGLNVEFISVLSVKTKYTIPHFLYVSDFAIN